MKLLSAVILTMLLSSSCTSKQPASSIRHRGFNHVKQIPILNKPSEEVTSFTILESIEDSVDIFKMSNMTISFSEDAYYTDLGSEYPKYNFDPTSDTLFIIQELGAWSENQFMKIESDSLTDFKVEQRFETSVSLSFEGPHCDMIDWKHSYTSWKPLVKNSKGEFRIDTLSLKDGEKFPKVSTEEFKEAIIKYCGSECLESFEGTPDPHTYPAWVGNSRIFIKITGVNKYNRQKHVRMIEILVPMGC